MEKHHTMAAIPLPPLPADDAGVDLVEAWNQAARTAFMANGVRLDAGTAVLVRSQFKALARCLHISDEDWRVASAQALQEELLDMVPLAEEALRQAREHFEQQARLGVLTQPGPGIIHP